MVTGIWYVSKKRIKFLDSVVDNILDRVTLESKSEYAEKRKYIRQKINPIFNSKTKNNYQFLRMLTNNEQQLKGEITSEFFANYTL